MPQLISSQQIIEKFKLQNMWAIFTKSEPQNIEIKNSFKQNFLVHEINKLQLLQKQVDSIQHHLRNTLKNSYNQNNLNHNELKTEVQDIQQKIQNVFHTIYQQNQSYQVSVQIRDLQKQNEHLFFKKVMKNYDDKRKILKDYIFRLENRVQEKESQTNNMTHRSYRSPMLPKPSTIMCSEINIKFKEKLDLRNKIIERIQLKFKEKQALYRNYPHLKPEISNINKKQSSQNEKTLTKLLNFIQNKQKIKRNCIKQKLLDLKNQSTLIDMKNRVIKSGTTLCENEQRFCSIFNEIKSKEIINKRQYHRYLNDLIQKMKSFFNQQKEFNLKRNISKSCRGRIQNSSKIQGFLCDKEQKSSNGNQELTASFLDHCKYLISERCVVDLEEDD